MKINAAAIRRTLLTATAAAAPLLPLLVDHHVLSATDATSVGAVLAALTGAWHGAAYVTGQGQLSLDEHVATALALAHPDANIAGLQASIVQTVKDVADAAARAEAAARDARTVAGQLASVRDIATAPSATPAPGMTAPGTTS